MSLLKSLILGSSLVACLSVPGYAAAVAASNASPKPNLPNVLPTATKPVEIKRDVQSLGGKLGFKMNSLADSQEKSFQSTITGNILGKQRSLLDVNVRPDTDLLEGETEMYVGTIQVITTSGRFENGAYVAKVEIPPVTARIPAVTLPVGPLTVKIDAGFALEASLSASLRPEIAVPLQDSALSAEIVPHAKALGYLEGYVSLLVLRGGVGGEVTVIDTEAHLGARLSFNGARPLYYSYGHLTYLSGKVYGFADHFDVFKWRWKRFWKPTLYSWEGTCLNLTFNSESAGACPIL